MKKIEAIKKQQTKLLLELAAYWTEEEGLCMNPFYKQKEEKAITENIELAKEIYPKVFTSHRNFVFNTFGDFKGLIPDKRMEELII